MAKFTACTLQRLVPLSAVALIGLATGQLTAQQAVQPTPPREKTVPTFIRVSGTGKDPCSLDVAITRYTSPDRAGVVVDLVAAVHVGEAEYYETLNELFKSCDVVLYELVAEAGTRVPANGEGGSAHPLSMIQGSIQAFLGLESQVEKIDYQPKNFRHADLSPADLAEKMRSRGDSSWTVALDALSQMMEQAASGLAAESSGDGMAGAFDLLTDPLKAKRFLARQFGNPEALEAGLGPKLNQLIVADRNEAAMKVLEDELEKGSRRIAIFYGAAHMPDFNKRMADAGFSPQAQSWLTAWDLTETSATADQPLPRLLELLKHFE